MKAPAPGTRDRAPTERELEEEGSGFMAFAAMAGVKPPGTDDDA